jgi:hypothetical protein
MPRASLLASASALTAAASVLVAADGANVPLQLTVLPQAYADSYGAACLDGSPPSFYSLVQDPTRWVIFAEGGGWCFDTTPAGVVSNCAGRAMGGGGSSKYNGPTTVIGGLLSPDPTVNPTFSNYSLAFLKYCDGTSTSSNATLPVPVPAEVRAALEAEAAADTTGSFLTTTAPTQIYFRGRANLIASFAYLRDHMGMGANVTDVIFSGGSAGATTVYLGLDFIATLLPPTTRLVGAPDAGFFLDSQNLAKGNTTWYKDCFTAADPLWNSSGSGSLNAGCMAANPAPGAAGVVKCFLQEYNAVFIKTPFAILNSAYDMWQTLNDIQIGCVPSTNGQPVAGVPSCTPAQMVTLQAFRRSQLAAVAPALQLPGTGAFIDSCFVHETNVDYCSTQSLPNCLGWNTYFVDIPNPVAPVSVNMDGTFAAWHASVTSQWAELTARRSAFVEDVVMAAAARGEDPNRAALRAGGMVGEGALPQTVWRPEAGTVQVIDPVEYPANPSCPFPKPTPGAARGGM